jgi:RNA polymerase sigma-70 factor (ECF subfamily)
LLDQAGDHELMHRAAQGDMRAYRMLVGKHLVKGVKVAERMLGNRQDAEDVMQETCLKIWKEAPRWRPEAKFSTWLYRVILNACLDRKRRVVPVMVHEFEDIIDDKPASDDVLMWKQKSDKVKRVLQSLPDRQRAAVVLSYYEEMSNQEAADALGMGLNAFQQLLFRAKQKMKEQLLEGEHEAARTGS